MLPALAIDGLCFRYGRSAGVRDVSLQLRPGDCCGFLGHNGAGKTTVLRLVLGLLRPHRGRIHIAGVDALAEPRRARAGVGALVERPGFHAAASALQNLQWLARLQGLPRRLARAEASRVLELTGLQAAADRRVGGFSLGMRQRLGIAQALLGRPPLLLLDEPTNGLDPEGIADLRRLLRQLCHDEGAAVLLSSHQLQELDGLCNHLAVLREGALVVGGQVAALAASLQPRLVVRGAPLAALEQCLREQGLPPQRDGDRLLVQPGARELGPLARALAAAGELHAFAPEPPSLEAIYLRATRGELRLPAPPPGPPLIPLPPVAASRGGGSAPGGPWRAFGHELRPLLARPANWLLLGAPALLAAASVLRYRSQVAGNLARVQRGELFSADAGSGLLAAAQGLQAAVPLLALVAAWFGSQAIAADLARDTLRNTLVRAVGRGDVLLAKFLALATLALGSGMALLVGAFGTAAALLGLGDLDEVTRHGDRQLLAAAADVLPAARTAALHLVLPLLAAAALGLLASALAPRPARALALALLLLVLPEALRDLAGEHTGWLLTSHLPTLLRDDSALGWFAAMARGAADASWPWASAAVAAPLGWLLAALGGSALLLRRLRVP